AVDFSKVPTATAGPCKG
nr:RecName: Full=Kunitz-type serine protease inhibitor D; Short=BmTI-D [Rhipicephalus microplus]